MNFSADQIIYDLSMFTGLTEQQTYEFVNPNRVNNDETVRDMKFVNPKSYEELVVYNRFSRTFIWECAIHPPWHEIKNIRDGSSVLDYGAGLGTDCLYMSHLGHSPVYFDINLAEIEFFKWRCKKYNVDIPIIEPYHNSKFDYVNCLSGTYDAIIFRDVLEHIPDYIRALECAIGLLNPKGTLLIQAPFGVDDIGVHIKEKWPISDYLISKGFARKSNVIWESIR